jgi:hypothetical protein
MGFIRTTALMIVGYFAMKAIKRVAKNMEDQLAKAQTPEPKQQGEMKTLRLDPVTGVYVPEA